MTDRDELLALAGQCEAATGADRELDAAIAVTCGTASDFPTFDRGFDTGAVPVAWSYEGCSLAQAIERHPERVRQAAIFYAVPAYTASLDAGMTLATGFVLLHLSDIGADGLPLCKLGDPTTTPTGEWTGIAARLELALCAAALRARAALAGGRGW